MAVITRTIRRIMDCRQGPSLFANSITRCFRKKLLRHILGYLALFSLLIYVELKTGFLVGRSCETGTLVTVFPNSSVQDEQQRSYFFFPRRNNNQPLIDSSDSNPASSSPTRFKVIPPGESVHMGHPDVFIPTAVQVRDYPQPGDFTILLHAWTRNFTDAKFSCCLLESLDDTFEEIISVQAIPHKQNAYPDSFNNNHHHNSSSSSSDTNTNYKVLSSEFYCSISAPDHMPGFKYVTFSSDNSCTDSKKVSRDVLKIESKERVFRSVGLCVSLQRTFVNAEFLVEWLEWYRLHGVTEVYVYYDHELSRGIERVLSYYKMVTFVRMFRLRHPEYYYRESLEAFHQEMASNDCRHRMSHFDYVITLDVSELLAPKELHTDIYDILKSASEMYPDAGVFQIHSYQIILDWRPSKNSPLHLARHELRSDVINMGEDAKLARWAYMPQRANISTKHRAWPKQAFTSKSVSRSSYSLLRFVRCHPRIAKECKETTSKVKDIAISRFHHALITAMREIPIDYVLEFNKRYVDMFEKVRIPGDSYFYGKG